MTRNSTGKRLKHYPLVWSSASLFFLEDYLVYTSMFDGIQLRWGSKIPAVLTDQSCSTRCMRCFFHQIWVASRSYNICWPLEIATLQVGGTAFTIASQKLEGLLNIEVSIHFVREHSIIWVWTHELRLLNIGFPTPLNKFSILLD